WDAHGACAPQVPDGRRSGRLRRPLVLASSATKSNRDDLLVETDRRQVSDVAGHHRGRTGAVTAGPDLDGAPGQLQRGRQVGLADVLAARTGHAFRPVRLGELLAAVEDDAAVAELDRAAGGCAAVSGRGGGAAAPRCWGRAAAARSRAGTGRGQDLRTLRGD